MKENQCYYCYDGSVLNKPKDLTYAQLVSGSWLDEDMRLTQVTIEGPQGLGFFLNNTPTPIRLWNFEQYLSNGYASSWSLDSSVGNLGPVYNIKFEAKTLRELINYNKTQINTNQYKYLIINYTSQN